MCKHGDTMVLVVGNKRFDVDRCIHSLVSALNQAGVYTVASCCGHGHRPGRIALTDGRELHLSPDFETATRIDALFPLDIHGNPPAAPRDGREK
jgi:hypothetical protein